VETDFERLIQLQNLDIEIKNTSLLLELLPRQIKEINQKIEESLKIVQDAKGKLAQNQKARRNQEAEVQDLKGKITTYKRQLNEVRTNKEYSALLKEIEEIQVKIDSLEEEIIEEMLAADDIEKEIKSADQKAEEIQNELSKQKEDILKRKKEIEDEKETLQKEKEELLPQVPSDQLNLYNQIFSKKNGIVLSPLRDEFCSMCHMRIRPQMVNELLAGNKIILCENCGRILYFPKKEV
jgi:predicted  nucleic acid-binding Zn-ribbon protein